MPFRFYKSSVWNELEAYFIEFWEYGDDKMKIVITDIDKLIAF